eukprot:6200156-Pleurochrysis_carterae.AAC.1
MRSCSAKCAATPAHARYAFARARLPADRALSNACESYGIHVCARDALACARFCTPFVAYFQWSHIQSFMHAMATENASRP